VGCAYDQDGGETEDETEEDKRDDLWRGVDDGDDYYVVVSLELSQGG
jgi:hypothetical protein